MTAHPHRLPLENDTIELNYVKRCVTIINHKTTSYTNDDDAEQATMLKKLKGKMKRRNTEPTMTLGATGSAGGVSSVPALTLAVAPQENDETSENNTDF